MLKKFNIGEEWYIVKEKTADEIKDKKIKIQILADRLTPLL